MAFGHSIADSFWQSSPRATPQCTFAGRISFTLVHVVVVFRASRNAVGIKLQEWTFRCLVTPFTDVALPQQSEAELHCSLCVFCPCQSLNSVTPYDVQNSFGRWIGCWIRHCLTHPVRGFMQCTMSSLAAV